MEKAFPKTVHGKFSITEFDILSSFEELIDVALKARKNRDINALKTINSEFYRRISNREMAGKIPTKTAKKGSRANRYMVERIEKQIMRSLGFEELMDIAFEARKKRFRKTK